MADGREIGAARNLAEFKAMLKKIPLESVIYHANRGDFANWLDYISEKAIAEDARKIKGNTGRVRTRMLTAVTPSVAKKILHGIRKAAARKKKKPAKTAGKKAKAPKKKPKTPKKKQKTPKKKLKKKHKK